MMKTVKIRKWCSIFALTTAFMMGVPGLYTWSIAEDIPKIIDISPVPNGSAFSPLVGPDGLFIEPRSGPLESIDAQFMVIGDVQFRIAPSIRFFRSRSGLPQNRANFIPGTFVEYLIDDAREVYAIWPSSGS